MSDPITETLLFVCFGISALAAILAIVASSDRRERRHRRHWAGNKPRVTKWEEDK